MKTLELSFQQEVIENYGTQWEKSDYLDWLKDNIVAGAPYPSWEEVIEHFTSDNYEVRNKEFITEFIGYPWNSANTYQADLYEALYEAMRSESFDNGYYDCDVVDTYNEEFNDWGDIEDYLIVETTLANPEGRKTKRDFRFTKGDYDRILEGLLSIYEIAPRFKILNIENMPSFETILDEFSTNPNADYEVRISKQLEKNHELEETASLKNLIKQWVKNSTYQEEVVDMNFYKDRG